MAPSTSYVVDWSFTPIPLKPAVDMGGNPESTCTVSRENNTQCLFPASQWDRLKTELMVLLLSCFQAKSVGNKGKLKVKWLCPFAADPVVFPWTFQMRKESGILHMRQLLQQRSAAPISSSRCPLHLNCVILHVLGGKVYKSWFILNI